MDKTTLVGCAPLPLHSSVVTMAFLTPQYVPNEYAYQCAKEFPDMCVAVGSVNPYRGDAIQELENCAANGVAIIKWLVRSCDTHHNYNHGCYGNTPLFPHKAKLNGHQS